MPTAPFGTRQKIADLSAGAPVENLTVTGNGADDVLQGGGGNDLLYGLGGNDTYIYNPGDGNDRIFESGWSGSSDTLKLGAGITAANTVVTQSGANVTLSFVDRPGSIYIEGGVTGAWEAGVENIRFDDGTVWRQPDLAAW